MRSILPVFFVLTVGAHAQFDSGLAPREVKPGQDSELPFEARGEAARAGRDESEVLIGRLNRLVIRSGVALVPPEDGPSAMGVDISGLTVGEQDNLGQALQGFLGAPLTANGLDRLLDTILRHYERHDRPVTDVFAPDQDLDGDTIRLEIIEGTVGLVGIEGGTIFNDRLLGGAVQLVRGENLTTSELQTHLDWFNRNPFRPAALYAAPGEGAGEADVVFSFTESRPWRVYAGYENSGSEAAGENRYIGGFNWGNAFGLDQLLSYQFTMGDSYDELHAHSASWEIPIHRWHHFLRLSGTWAEISTENADFGSVVTSQGTSWQIGAAYGTQLPRWKDFKQEVSLGGEFKSSDNFLVFGDGDAHPGSVVEVVQFRADYRATRRFETGALDVQASLVGSPGGLSGRNEDRDFELFRAGADASYLYARTRVIWLRKLPKDWALRLRGQAQLASGALLPTEQLGLGGHATVRGYEEREYLADHGYAVSAELRTPALDLPTGKLPDSAVQFLAFLDHGAGWRDETGSGEKVRDTFLGAGLGARLELGGHASLRADLGIPLDEGGGPRGHVGVTVSF